MLTFSKLHAAQNDTAVMQILVFTSIFAQDRFEKRYGDSVSECAEASDTGLGAAYKLRAVLDSDGSQISIIRCGFSGRKLWESPVRYSSVTQALEAAISQLKDSLLFENVDLS